MKICFLTTNLSSGGAERTIAYLSSYLVNQGHQVDVLILGDTIFYDLDAKVNVIVGKIPSKYDNILNKYKNILRRSLLVRTYLKKQRPDVVFCMLFLTAKYCLRLKKRYGFYLISSERNNPAIPDSKSRTKFKLKTYQQSEGIVFQTQRAMAYFPPAIAQKGVVIHNAMGNDLVHQWRPVNKRERKITAIGRLALQKDYPTLLHAFAKVAKQHPDMRLEIFGNGSEKNALEQLGKELGIGQQLVFQGAQKDAILQAAAGSCYVMSSLYEGMPNALMEAMAVGLPCVSTDCPNGPAELIRHGENGLLVPVGDVDALAQAMLKMIEEPMFAEKCGAKAKEILDTHSVTAKAAEYHAFIQQVCAQEVIQP